MNTKKNSRIITKINNGIKKLKLDLSNLIILTEVGSDNYVYTPIIAAMANAKLVYAFTKDSKYGLAKDNIEKCSEIINDIGLNHKIKFIVNEINENHIREVDMITNSGFLRPLNSDLLIHAKKNLVIPLMYEKWEFRNSDIDINYCLENNIKVAGTWESHPLLKIFEHVGILALKMTFNAGYEVLNNKIIVWSNDDFGKVIKNYFIKSGANEVILTNNESDLMNNLNKVDFIFICDYKEKREYGTKEFFDFKELIKINKDFGVIHLYGKINYKKNYKILSNIFPYFNGYSNVMSYTLDYVGLNPLINLQIAGFKVGESLIKNYACEFSQLIESKL